MTTKNYLSVRLSLLIYLSFVLVSLSAKTGLHGASVRQGRALSRDRVSLSAKTGPCRASVRMGLVARPRDCSVKDCDRINYWHSKGGVRGSLGW
jgi:hypothetical protein